MLRMDMNEYWRQLETALNEFKAFETDQADQENYEKQRATLQSMWELGTKIQRLGAWEMVQKAAAMGQQLNTIPLTAYPDSDGVPSITGPLSLDFAEKVYLPYLERFANVDLGILATFAPKGLTPKESYASAANKATVLRARIEAYKNPQPNISKPLPSLAEEESKVPVVESEYKKEIQKLDEESSQLKSKQQNLQQFCSLLQTAQDDEKVASQLKKSTLKNILDPEKKYESLSECLDNIHLTVVKERLLEHEKNNKFPWNLSGYYKPFQALKDCSMSVVQELARVNKRLTDIEQKKTQRKQAFEKQKEETLRKEAEMADAEAKDKAQKALDACLDELLRDRTKSFMYSDKSSSVKMLQGSVKQGHVTDQKAAVASLREDVKNPRHKNRWYVWTWGRTPTSLGIVNKYFDEQNNPKPATPPKSRWFAWLWSAPKTPASEPNTPTPSPPSTPRKNNV